MSCREPEQPDGFPLTHWSKIYLASNREREEGLRALGELIERYRPALQAHLRHRFSSSPEQAGEWLDAFIERRILESDLLRQAKETKGRFRGFLVKSLDRFVIDQIRRENRQYRKPTGGSVPFDGLSEQQMPMTDGRQPDPGDRVWAIQVIDQAKDRTEAFYRSKGNRKSWEVFLHGFYLPVRSGAARPRDGELASRFGFDSPTRVSNTIITVKRKFGKCVREVVAEYVSPNADIDAEIEELMAILGNEETA